MLRERNYGVFENKPLRIIKQQRRRRKIPRYKFRPEGGESYDDVKKRLAPFLNKTIGEYKNKTIILVTHGDVIRLVSHLLIKKPMINLAKMRFRRASINIFEFKNGKFTFRRYTKHL